MNAAAGTISELRLKIAGLEAQLLVEGISEAERVAILTLINTLQTQINILLSQSTGITHASYMCLQYTSMYIYTSIYTIYILVCVCDLDYIVITIITIVHVLLVDVHI
jgi:hypothetical protein